MHQHAYYRGGQAGPACTAHTPRDHGCTGRGGGVAVAADSLTPASREDALLALNYSLRFGLTGKPHRATDSSRVAEIQLSYLERSGFVLMRRPSLPMPGTAPNDDGQRWLTTARQARRPQSQPLRGPQSAWPFSWTRPQNRRRLPPGDCMRDAHQSHHLRPDARGCSCSKNNLIIGGSPPLSGNSFRHQQTVQGFIQCFARHLRRVIPTLVSNVAIPDGVIGRATHKGH